MPGKYLGNKCKVCGGEYHHCSSCGHVSCKEHGCCTEVCWAKTLSFVEEVTDEYFHDYEDVIAIKLAKDYRKKILRTE
jgi:hypothetical protein